MVMYPRYKHPKRSSAWPLIRGIYLYNTVLSILVTLPPPVFYDLTYVHNMSRVCVPILSRMAVSQFGEFPGIVWMYSRFAALFLRHGTPNATPHYLMPTLCHALLLSLRAVHLVRPFPLAPRFSFLTAPHSPSPAPRTLPRARHCCLGPAWPAPPGSPWGCTCAPAPG
jgi:hypothetical protein